MSATTTAEPSLPASTSTTASPSRSTKRKLDDALHSLDEALRPLAEPDPLSQPPSSKKARVTRSIYSTLAKYGIKSAKPAPPTPPTFQDAILTSAPHLAAILARTAARTRQALPFKLPVIGQISAPKSAPPSTCDYRPSSITSFLSRLSTFKLTTYANKPSAIDAVAASKCGWINDGKDRLVCGICNNSWVVGGRDGMSKDAANALVEKQKASLIGMHKDGCPWKVQQCDSTIYRIPLKPPAALAKDIKARAVQLHAALEGIEIRHPLTSAQVQSLLSILPTVPLSAAPASQPDAATAGETENNGANSTIEAPSETAILTSLFGWTLAPPAPPAPSRPRTPSLSRASSVVPPSVPGTPGATRLLLPAMSRESTPGPSTSSPNRPSAARLASSVSARLLRKDKEVDSRLLQCTLCQRRVGLWAFTSATALTLASSRQGDVPVTPGPATPGSKPKRQFDILKEHRSYCPYVVRSTMVPSLPAPIQNYAVTNPSQSSPTSGSASRSQLNGNNDLIEGWRAVLTVVLRNGLGRRQRQRSGMIASVRVADGAPSDAAQIMDNSEYDGIEAIVDDVKAHGGKTLLKYVRSLLS